MKLFEVWVWNINLVLKSHQHIVVSWCIKFSKLYLPLTDGHSSYGRPREIFRGFSALWFLKYLGQFLSALAISGHSERFSPGKIRSEVGGPLALNSPSGRPTSEPFGPGENLSKWPEIARALRNWPKHFKNHRAENPRKISRDLVS